MRSAAVLAIAQKYVEDARRATRPVVFRDAVVAENEIIVKADEFADDLSGFQGYRFQLGKRGKLGRTETVTMPNPPSISGFITWARAQPTKVLRALLQANGIRATGTVHVPMAHLLAYLYEDRQAKAVGIPLAYQSDETKAENRAKRVRALKLAVTLSGVRDEEVMVQMGFWVERGDIEGQFTKYAERLKERVLMADQKPSDLMKQLRSEADATEEKKSGGKRGRDPEEAGEEASGEEEKPPKRGEKAKRGEQEAIVAGKGKGDKKESKKDEKPKASEKSDKGKGGDKKEKAKTADNNEGEEAKVKAKAKGGAKKKAEKPAKAEKKDKPAKESKTGSGMKQTDFKKEEKVKYIGSRNEELKGKTLEVIGPRGPKGVWLKTSDGTRASAMAHQLEKIKK
jgi:hypothetical protein